MLAAHLILVRALAVVVRQPDIQIGLQLFQREVKLASERDLIELQQDRLMEVLTDTVGLRMPDLGLGVLDVVQYQVELVVMSFSLAAILILGNYDLAV
ncbi:MAG: hypothetical protein A2580_12910 [Hydrogenophilales bacterium RIFOXYD1_FULL_62_11]|nr:MAG: hypothetical protein A2580_12910 [Hydrogenophilales bacterium RIFOXYD1_FULL_62_11]